MLRATVVDINKVTLLYLVYKRLATGWKVRGSNPDGGDVFRTYPDPSLLYSGYRVFPGGKSGRGVTTTHPI